MFVPSVPSESYIKLSTLLSISFPLKLSILCPLLFGRHFSSPPFFLCFVVLFGVFPPLSRRVVRVRISVLGGNLVLLWWVWVVIIFRPVYLLIRGG